ncbi:hypothetical protein [Algoriphagus sp.]|uniref:hypothetical protein n=1 Tax=Algoriphagus sp. TaxID=1872435 RepID=UPI003F6FF8D6
MKIGVCPASLPVQVGLDYLMCRLSSIQTAREDQADAGFIVSLSSQSAEGMKIEAIYANKARFDFQHPENRAFNVTIMRQPLLVCKGIEIRNYF